MSSQLEGAFYFSVMALAILVTITFTYFMLKTTKSSNKVIVYSLIISLLLFITACIWWGMFASDGFSQVFGWLFYGAAFILVNIITTLLSLKKKKASVL
ncbi:hypothetical protein [Mesobacillus harenae]|uniref:hypothetical protein n=1 Tax=Mesobacillus harenae TaxID=2213203 RepID=UPI0015801ACA|nr:hypothetical protein [Mesobacillus harenae]